MAAKKTPKKKPRAKVSQAQSVKYLKGLAGKSPAGKSKKKK